MEDKIRKAIKEQIKKLKEGMSPEEWADAKEKERLNQHPEKDTINKIKQMMDKEEDDKEQEEYDKGWYREGEDKEKEDKIDTIKKMAPKTNTKPLRKLAGLKEIATKLGYLKEDYKPSHRAYNVIDKSDNDKIVAKELPRWKALELAHTDKNYMISATDKLAEEEYNMDLMRYHGGERDKAAVDAYEKEYKKTEVSEVDGMEGGNISVSNKFDHSKFDFQEKVTKASFVYTEQGGHFYSLTLSTSDDRQIKLKYSEANSWLKDTLEYIHEGDLLPRRYNSGLEDLDLIVARLEELGIEASHGDYMDVS